MELVVFLLSLLVSVIFTRGIRDFAIRKNLVSAPTSARHVHTRPIPRCGGVAILLTVWSLIFMLHWIPGRLHMTGSNWRHVALGILGPATLICLVGLVDDLRGLTARFKFLVQILAAVLLYFNGSGISQVSAKAGGASVGWMIGLPLTVLWVLWITNAFNLIDGLDGLAAGSALFSTLVICVIALVGNNNVVLFFTLVLAGAITGFLRYNFNPASIFLGDSGSLLIGFLLSAVALAGSQKSPTMVAVAIPILSLGLPILDVAIAVIRRFLAGRRLFEADREHIHHRLISRGIPHKQAVLLLYGVSACFGLLSLFLLNPAGRNVGIVLVVLGIGVLVGVQQLRYHEFFELKQAASRTLNMRQVIANDVSIRRAAESLRTCDTASGLCTTLQSCLEPMGFDGFGIFLTSELLPSVDCSPLKKTSRANLQFLWDDDLSPSDANWSLTFCLQENGCRLGRFTLFRKSMQSQIWVDMNVFTAAAFASELSNAVKRIQNRWLIASSAPAPASSGTYAHEAAGWALGTAVSSHSAPL
jgi:UDP-GlcNAc:undecaprenyl-phosphate GlcNAc-1-phosphate transferase